MQLYMNDIHTQKGENTLNVMIYMKIYLKSQQTVLFNLQNLDSKLLIV